MRFEVVPAKAHHVGAIARRLRRCHLAAFASIGADPRVNLRQAFALSSFCRTWMVDGRPEAIGGVSGSLISPSGCVWVAFSEAATRYPVALMREARVQLREIMSTRSDVESALLAADPVTWRFAQALGFFLKGPNGEQMVFGKKRRLESILDDMPGFRVRLPGGGSGVLVGYHG